MPLRTLYGRYRCSVTLLALASLLALVGCSSVPQQSSTQVSAELPSSPRKASSSVPTLPRAGSGRGGYYQDDGPGDTPPEGLLNLPDPEPQVESYSTRGNRPYVVFGKTYTPITDERSFKQRGIGSWYGKKFHRQKTSSGELYDMYKMTAAHPTLPIPSYARVTNLANGKQVIVRINDRGPFHANRIIDLSYTAALKLGYLDKGSSELEVERLLPKEIARIVSDKKEQRARAEQAIPTPEVLAAAAAAVESASRAEVASVAPLAVKVNESAAPAVESELQLPAKPVVVDVAPATTTATAPPGFYLQLGSYTQAANAEAARSRLMQTAGVSLPPVEMVEYGLFYRLYSGPFATREDAAAVAAQLQDSAFKPLVVQR